MRGQTFDARVVPGDDSWWIEIVRPTQFGQWVGGAEFPVNYYEVAVERLIDLKGGRDVDVEDLLREWGEESVRDDFVSTMAIAKGIVDA